MSKTHNKKKNFKDKKKHYGKKYKDDAYPIKEEPVVLTGDEIVGKLEKHKSGFAFVRHEDGDIFIGRNNMKNAMNGDTVTVDLLPEYLWEKNREGIVDRVVERAHTEIVGVLETSRKYGFVVPENSRDEDVFVRKADFRNAQDGDTVVVRITKYPTKDASAEGRVIEVVSKKGEKTGAIKALIRSHGLLETFPSRVNAEAKAMSKREITEEDIEKRRDLRDKTIVTIDGAYSKDLDDAISIEKLENGNYLLGVHIADVSHYVADGGHLDREALKRGNSTYLLNWVVPMLPNALSNGICSLNEGVDRLTLSCDMEINDRGNVVNHEIYESVINNKARLVYDDVSDIIENKDEALIKKYEDIYDEILLMNELADILRAKRKSEGSLDFDIDEAEIVLDENEVPIEIGIAERRCANRIIEEFMLAANRTVAEHFFWMEYPFIYRVHEKPDSDKISELKTFLAGFGINLSVNPDNIHPRILNDILEDIKGKPYENIVGTVILRSMKKAVYSTECDGHFGLACKYYSHFTSPIRRYPDLMIHRIIKASITGNMTENMLSKFKTEAEIAADTSSMTERKSQEMEREVEKMKKAEYMEDKVGTIFDGVISGVTDFGIYVQLPDTIEGMVRLDSLTDDYYVLEKERYRVRGERTGKIYSLGDKVTVCVTRADAKSRQIDFELMTEEL